MIHVGVEVQDRVRRISAVAEDIARRPFLGSYEVGVLEDLLVELRRVTGLAAEAGDRGGCQRPQGGSAEVGQSVVPSR